MNTAKYFPYDIKPYLEGLVKVWCSQKLDLLLILKFYQKQTNENSFNPFIKEKNNVA